jgi:agmatine deiminase
MNSSSPKTLCQPAEWAPHSACWLAWPSHADLWGPLDDVRAEFRALCEAIADPDPVTRRPRGEKLRIVTLPTEESRRTAAEALGPLGAEFFAAPFGDIWLRDTAPVFARTPANALTAVSFRFNGWGEKYVLPGDADLSQAIAGQSGLAVRREDWVFEGGSLDVDGEGTGLTSEQCLLNPNRNPALDREQISARLRESLGVEKLLWLGDGLLNDHTDGHVDNIARFVAPGRVVCMEALSPDDPNRAVLDEIAARLRSFTDARGRQLDVVRIPSPGRVENDEGKIVPVSYVNFYIANTTVVVPCYNPEFDARAVAALRPLFPGRRVVGLPASTILTGGGSFHCITQQVPEL